MSNHIRLNYGSNLYYIKCYDHETIDDIKIILVKKYNFVDDVNFGIYQGSNQLELSQKIKELVKKDDLYVKGIIKSNVSNKLKIKRDNSTETNIISMFREMRFNETEEIINDLLMKNENKLEVVISTLLLNKKKAKKVKSCL